jgi:hypothetical protein
MFRLTFRWMLREQLRLASTRTGESIDQFPGGQFDIAQTYGKRNRRPTFPSRPGQDQGEDLLPTPITNSEK